MIKTRPNDSTILFDRGLLSTEGFEFVALPREWTGFFNKGIVLIVCLQSDSLSNTLPLM